LVALGSETNSDNGVVELGSALGGVEDTRGVRLEDGSVGLNGDGSWSKSNSGLELGGAVWLDVGVGSNTDDTFGGLSLAASVSGGVGVLRLKLLLGLLEVFPSPLLPSTGAAMGLSVTVNELLLSKLDELTGLDLVVSLKGGGGRESPA